MYIGPRLTIEHDRDDDGTEYIYSGNGSTVDILVKRDGAWQIKQSVNVFADHSSTVCGIVALTDKEAEGRKLICCFGERSIALFARDELEDEQDLPATNTRTVKDWVLGVRPIGLTSNKLAVISRYNVVTTYEFHLVIQGTTFVLDQLETIECEAKVALFSAVFTGNTYNTLRVLAGDAMGNIIFWKPSDKGKVERKIEGHKGPIFGLLEHNHVVYTISDDRSLRSWSLEEDIYRTDQDGKQQFTVYAHSARPFAITQSQKYGIITGAADGNVCLWAFKMGVGFGLRKTIAATKSAIRSLKIVDDTLFLGSGNGELCVISLHEEAFFSESTFAPKVDLRNFAPLGDGRTIFVNKNHELIQDRGGELTILDKLKNVRFDTFKLSPSGHWIAWNLEGSLVVYNVAKNVFKKKAINSPNGLFWLEGDSLLVSTMDGALCMIDPASNSQITRFDTKTKSPAAKAIPVPTCACLRGKDLYVGFKTGYIQVFKTNRIDPIANVRAHGSEGVCDIYGFEDRFMSVGRNGKACEWRVEKDEDGFSTIVSLNKRPVGAMGISWPAKILTINGRTMLAGFNSDEFVVMDLQEEYILCRYQCGSGKREWMCETILQPSGSFEFKLRYVLRGGIRTVILNAFEKRTLVSGVHSEQITCIHTLRVKTAVPLKSLMITGGTDTEVVVSTLDITGKHDVLYRYKTLSAVLDISGHKNFVISVGGRSEMILWKIEGKNGSLIQLGKKRLETDCRFISAQLLSHSEKNDLYAVVAGSDNTVRLFAFNTENKDDIATLLCEHKGSDLATFTKISGTVIDGDRVRVYATSSNGKMTRLSMSLTPSKDENEEEVYKCEVERDFGVSNCGLSSLSVLYGINNTAEDFVAMGDEAGELFVMFVPHCPTSKIERAASCQAHSSNITGISCHLVGPCPILYLTGIDSRISLALYQKQNNTLNVMKQKIVNVSDPAALMSLDPSNPNCFRYIVVGAGMQMVNFEKRAGTTEEDDE